MSRHAVLAELEPHIFASVWVALAIAFIVFSGSVVQAGLGMGFGLTVAPVLALIDPVLVPVPALFMGTATAIWGAVGERANIVWKEVGIGMAGRASGILIGTFVLLQMTSRSTFSLVFGIIIMFAVGLSLAGWRLPLTIRNLMAMGFVSGFTGVITSVGAPPLALIYQHRPATETRATLATFFAIGGMASLSVLYVSGWANLSHLWIALFMVPPAFVGTVIGRRVRGRFDKRYRHFLLGIAALASVLLIIRGVS